MTEIAEIFKDFGPSDFSRFGSSIHVQHRKVINDIVNCRTPVMGGGVYYCNKCIKYHYSYHSCGNRHCPKCQSDLAEKWLLTQRNLLLPVRYFMVTFTLHDNLRKLANRYQKLIFNLLFKLAVESMQKLAADPKYIGGMLGIIGVLHTWTRNLLYHPHVHFVLPGGGFSIKTNNWVNTKGDFLLPVKALSIIFKAKFKDTLKKQNPELFKKISSNTWKDEWVVNSISVGNGETALKYLAPYIFRVAISNKRIISIKNNTVCFTYKDSNTKKIKMAKVTKEEFIRRFLKHVLPKGFLKIRYYGLFSYKNRPLLQKVRELFKIPITNDAPHEKTKFLKCPSCGEELIFIMEVQKGGSWPNAPPKNGLDLMNTNQFFIKH